MFANIKYRYFLIPEFYSIETFKVLFFRPTDIVNFMKTMSAIHSVLDEEIRAPNPKETEAIIYLFRGSLFN